MCDFTLDDVKRIVLEALEESKNAPRQPKTYSYIDQTIVTTIVNHLNQLSGKNFRDTNETTKRLIAARYKEGYTISDFTAVLNGQWEKWKNDKKMIKFFRPETLFGNKFESYTQYSGEKEEAKVKPYNEWSMIEKQLGKPKELWNSKELQNAEGM